MMIVYLQRTILPNLLLIIFTISTSTAYAQQKRSIIYGQLSDTSGTIEWSYIRVLVLKQPDSAIVFSTKPDSAGKFQLLHLHSGRYIGFIDGNNIEPRDFDFSTDDSSSVIYLEKWRITPKASVLATVIITAPLLRRKGDTTIINATKINSGPNAAVEDLFRNVPGATVTSDGRILYLGKEINNILVDGNPFFGNDYQIASKKLPADYIGEIKIYDDKLGFQPSENETSNHKTINLILKPNRRKGNFGSGEAGAGIKSKYTIDLNLNHFDNGFQLSFIGNSNNGYQPQIAGTNGINNSYGKIVNSLLGINFNNKFGTKTTVSANASHSNITNTIQSVTDGVNYFSGDSLNRYSRSENTRSKQSYDKVGFSSSTRISESNTLTEKVSIIHLKSSGTGTGSNILFGTRDTIYSSNTLTSIESYKSSLNAEINFNHHLKNSFSNWDAGISASHSQGTDSSLNTAYNHFYTNRLVDTTNNSHLNQAAITSLNMFFNSKWLIGKNHSIELLEKISMNDNLNAINTYQPLESDNKIKLLDSAQSNRFRSVNAFNLLTLKYMLSYSHWLLVVGSSFQYNNLVNSDFSRQTTYHYDYPSLLPMISLSWKPGNSRELIYTYNTQTRLPGIQQLQPIVKTTDSLNFYQGNPGLSQSVLHNMSLAYTSFNEKRSRAFSANVNAVFTNDDIQNEIWSTADGKQYTTPRNVGGNYFLTAIVNYSSPLNKSNGQFSANPKFYYSQAHAIVNKRDVFNRSFSFEQAFTVNVNLSAFFNMSAFSNTAVNFLIYQTDSVAKQKYFTQQCGGFLLWSNPNGWVGKINLSYYFNWGTATTKDINSIILSPSIGKLWGKNKRCTLQLSLFDLLNTNKNVANNASASYSERTLTNATGRYSMLTFKYNLALFKQARH